MPAMSTEQKENQEPVKKSWNSRQREKTDKRFQGNAVQQLAEEFQYLKATKDLKVSKI